MKAPPCERGYIHLLSRRYEVRDAQTLLGKLADEGVINPQQIGTSSWSNHIDIQFPGQVDDPNGSGICYYQYWRDGKKIFEMTDPDPYTRGWFGIRTTKNHMQVRNLRMMRLVPAQ